MADYTIDANVYRDGVLIASAYGSGSTLAHATHMVTSDLSNLDENDGPFDGTEAEPAQPQDSGGPA